MDLSHNSRSLVCLPWAKIIAVSKERARAAAVSGWFIVSVDGYLLRLHHKGCKIECSCERFPLPPDCIVFFLWSVFSAHCPSSCSWTVVVSSGAAAGVTVGLTLDKVNQVNWLFCGRGFARADVWFDSTDCLFIPCIHPCTFAAGFWVWGFFWFSLLHNLEFERMYLFNGPIDQ